MPKWMAALAFFMGLIAFPQSVPAAPVHDFNEAMAGAYGHYRAAAFYLRTENPAVASVELRQMAARWKAIQERFGKSPPGIYSRDRQWQSTLEKISQRTADGLKAASGGDAKAARKHIGPIRKMLSQLRRRNGVVTYSDCVDQANLSFKRLFRFRHNPPGFEPSEPLDALRRQTAVTQHWYEKCRKQAPKAFRDNPEFIRLMDRSLYSLSRIWVAIREKNELNLINILRGLHSSDQLLFLKFG